MLSFRISYWNLVRFPYFADTTERGDRRWKEAQRQGEDVSVGCVKIRTLFSSHILCQIVLFAVAYTTRKVESLDKWCLFLGSFQRSMVMYTDGSIESAHHNQLDGTLGAPSNPKWQWIANQHQYHQLLKINYHIRQSQAIKTNKAWKLYELSPSHLVKVLQIHIICVVLMIKSLADSRHLCCANDQKFDWFTSFVLC
jgi:hypothetical protein